MRLQVSAGFCTRFGTDTCAWVQDRWIERMNPDDRLIVAYLKSWPRLFVSAREIARRAGGKRRFRDEPQWAFPILARLVEQEMIETDALRHCRLIQKMV